MRLSKVQKFYIENNREASPKKIAKDLGISQSRVEAHLKKLPPSKEAEPEVQEAPPEENDMGNYFGVSKDGKSVTMTGASSQLADDFQKSVSRGMNREYLESLEQRGRGKIFIPDKSKPSF